MKKLIAIALLLGTALSRSDAHAACNPHGTSAEAKMCRLEALSGQFGDLNKAENLKRAGAALLGKPKLSGGTCNLSPEINQAIMEGSAYVGFEFNRMTRLACARSHGDPNPVNGSRKGLMQLTEEEMRSASDGRGNVFNPRDSVMAAGMIMKQFRPQSKRPYFDPEWIRRGVAAGTISQEQMVWYLRYNAGENPGPFPPSRPIQTPSLESPPPLHCTTSWTPVGIGGEWQTECR